MSSHRHQTPAASFRVRLMDALFARPFATPTISDRHPMAACFVSKSPEKKKRKTSVESADSDDNGIVEWILLATHALQRLLMEDNNNKIDNAMTMAWLSYAMATAFGAATASNSSSKFAKHLLGHWRLVVAHAATLSVALIAATPAASGGEEANVSSPEDKDMALCAALAALEVATRLGNETVTFHPAELLQYWQQHVRNHHPTPSTTSTASSSSSSLDWSREDQCCLALMTSSSSSSLAATASRRTRRQPPAASTSPDQLLRSLLFSSDAAAAILIECRLPLKRWAPAAWTWYLQGPELVLRALVQRLEAPPTPPSAILIQFLPRLVPLLTSPNAGTRAPSTSGTSYDTAASAWAQHVHQRLGRGETTTPSNLAPSVVALLYHVLRAHYESAAPPEIDAILALLRSDWSFTGTSSDSFHYYIASFILSLQGQHRAVDIALTDYAVSLLRSALGRHSAVDADAFPWPPPLPTDSVDPTLWEQWISTTHEAASCGFLLLELLELLVGTTKPTLKKRGRLPPVRVTDCGPSVVVEPICATLCTWLDRGGMLVSASLATRLLQVGTVLDDGWSAHPTTLNAASWCVGRQLLEIWTPK
jgi:hypothetical protein